MAAPHTLPEVAPYRALELIGEGGVGRVYLAENAAGERVALKLLHPSINERPALATQFLYDAWAVAEIDHPNVASVLDAGTLANGETYVAVEYVEGRDLAEVLAAEDALDWQRVVEIGRVASQALATAHARGLLHLDLKPNNLRLTLDPEGGERVKLLDFGLGAAPPHLRPTDALGLGALGTPEYWSPEQASAQPLDGRSDIYSLGVILFEALTGTPPFTSHSYSDLVAKHLFAVPSRLMPPASCRPIPTGVQEIVLRCLAKEPADRFANAAELVAALAAVARGDAAAPALPAKLKPVARLTPAVRVVSMRPVTSPWSIRRWGWPAAAIGAMSVAASLALYITYSPGLGAAENGATPRAGAAAVARPEARWVEIEVTSEPSGAFIYRAGGGALLGETPARLKFPRGEEPVALVVRLPDGQRLPLHFVPNRSAALMVRSPRLSGEPRKSP